MEFEEGEENENVKKFTADFETATWIEDETWVWAWALCEIGNEENLKIGNSIKSFFETIRNEKNPKIYFHNLKFDGEFIIYYLLKNGFTHVIKNEEITDKTFTTLISDMGQFYSITVYFKKDKNRNTKKITFYDSLKIIPFSVSEIAKSFNLPISKLEIDYKEKREKGHILTDKEKEYIKNDVLIVAKALNVIFNEGLTRMTEGSNALSDFKKIITENKFEHYFIHLDKKLDEELRKSYKGGFTYLSPEFKEKDVGCGIVLDVNSLYPSVMYSEKFPFGNPEYFDGKYENDNVYDLYIQVIRLLV